MFSKPKPTQDEDAGRDNPYPNTRPRPDKKRQDAPQPSANQPQAAWSKVKQLEEHFKDQDQKVCTEAEFRQTQKDLGNSHYNRDLDEQEARYGAQFQQSEAGSMIPVVTKVHDTHHPGKGAIPINQCDCKDVGLQ